MFVELNGTRTKADDALHPNEERFLAGVAKRFGMTDTEFAYVKARHVIAAKRNPYDILGVTPTIGNDELKSHYRKLIAETHPDKLIARGVPKEFVVIATEKVARVAPVGWAAAYDNRRLLVGFDATHGPDGRTSISLLQSLDGGVTWRGLAGEEKATPLYLFNSDHASGRGDVVGPRADVLLFNNLGCAGPNIASLRPKPLIANFRTSDWGPGATRPTRSTIQPAFTVRSLRRTEVQPTNFASNHPWWAYQTSIRKPSGSWSVGTWGAGGTKYRSGHRSTPNGEARWAMVERRA